MGGKQVHRGDSRCVLAFLPVHLQFNVDEAGGKYSEGLADVYLPLFESNQCRQLLQAFKSLHRVGIFTCQGHISRQNINDAVADNA